MKGNFLRKLQKLSLAKRKLIFWSIMIFLGFIFLIIFIFTTANRLKNFSPDKLKEDIQIPSFDSSRPVLPDNTNNVEEQQNN